MAQFPQLPLYTDAYLADTRHLNAAQHGAYLLLLMMAWRTPDCAIPDDDDILARWACMDKRTWKTHRDVILAFWRPCEVDGVQKFRQHRLLDERKRAEDLHSKNVAAGKTSALKRKERGSTTVITEPQPKSNPQTQTQKEVDKSTSDTPKKESKNANPSTSIAVTLRNLETIPDEQLAQARALGFSESFAKSEWTKFCNHHISVKSKHTVISRTWHNWCSNVPEWKRSGSTNAGATAGRSGSGGYDKVAAAKSRAMAELFGEQPQESGGQAAGADSSTDIWGTGGEEAQADYVDVTAGDDTFFDQAEGVDGISSDSHVGTTLSQQVK